jgi:hypothetical protein
MCVTIYLPVSKAREQLPLDLNVSGKFFYRYEPV